MIGIKCMLLLPRMIFCDHCQGQCQGISKRSKINNGRNHVLSYQHKSNRDVRFEKIIIILAHTLFIGLHLWLQYCFPLLLDYGKHWEEILKFLFFLLYVRQDKIIEQCHFVYDKVHHNYNKIHYTIQSNSIPTGVR